MSKKLLKSTLVVSTMTFISRISGLIRDIAFAQFLGTGLMADAFFVAFRIPNFLRRIFAEGALSVAFIPVFTEFRENNSAGSLRAFVDHLAGRLGLILLGLTVVGVVLMPLIVAVIAMGWYLDFPEKFVVTVEASRITFPYLFFISFVAMAAGILNSLGRFAVAAATPVLLNLSLIAAVIWLVPMMENAAMALAIGVSIAGLAQFLFQAPFLRAEGLLPRPRIKSRSESDVEGREGVRRVFKLMLPAIFGSSIAQINLLVGTLLASFLVSGSVSWLYYSDRLMEFPLGVFGIALATVLLPSLSRHHANDASKAFSELLDWSLRWVVLIVLPASVGLIVLAGPLLTTMFQYGEFSAHDVKMASGSLFAFAVGLVGLVLIKVLSAGFFARQNTRTPVRVGIYGMIVNVIASLGLVSSMAHVGLALATSISALFQAFLLFWLLRKEGVYSPQAGWPIFITQVVSISTIMGTLLWWGVGDLQGWLDDDLLQRIFRLIIWVGAGILVYVLGILLVGVRPRQLLLKGG